MKISSDKFKITVQFRSLKDIGQVYKLQLKNLDDIVSSITTTKELRETELLLKELVAVVETRLARNIIEGKE